MTMGKAILFSEMTPDASFESDFHHWYDTEHIPIRMKCDGFVSGQRYRSDAGPGFLAVYDMTDLSALKTPDYTKIKTQPSEQTRWMLDNVRGFTRYLGNEIHRNTKDAGAIDAPILYAVWFNVPQDRASEFNDWYESEHIPLLMKAQDWRMVRRFRIVDGEPGTWSHLALHYLASIAALQSPEREVARKTAWRDKLAAESWFKGNYSIFERHGDRHIGISAVI
ncbi:DUF4286 family protein [Pseudorhodoplanes sinuspersici]|nr:DUF4286 family protein [Pseudorhodoplanes sinuspersici]RKE74305.1 hypothetical protein DFP91_2209 [Pseudorhodoplanes sinuspersici]